jgi:hypothetical protein
MTAKKRTVPDDRFRSFIYCRRSNPAEAFSHDMAGMRTRLDSRCQVREFRNSSNNSILTPVRG